VLKVSDGVHDFRNFYRLLTGNEYSSHDPTSAADINAVNGAMQLFVNMQVALDGTSGVSDQYGTPVAPANVPMKVVQTLANSLAPYMNGPNSTIRDAQELKLASDALPNESKSEFTGRVGGHEGEHIITRDLIRTLPANSGKSQQLQRNVEYPSFIRQKKIVEDQRNNRR